MNTENLELLFQLVGSRLVHSQTHRLPITAKQSLTITLRYLASGASMTTLAFGFQVSPSAISNMIPEVLDALCAVLQPLHLPTPTAAYWKQKADEFWMRWNLPNCVGAIDGKHVRIQCPPKSSSNNYNYKKFFSTVLMAVADAKYRFSFIDVGAYGSEGDSTIFAKSALGQGLDEGKLFLPAPAALPNSIDNDPVPHVFVADEAFPLKPYIMRPFGGTGLSTDEHVFNYRLCRGRRVVENAFGILVAKFRIFHTPIHARPEVVDKIIFATCCLHNFLIDHQGLVVGLADSEDCGVVTAGEWRSESGSIDAMSSVGRLSTNNYSGFSRQTRDKFMKYFVSAEGQLAWQLEHVNKGRGQVIVEELG